MISRDELVQGRILIVDDEPTNVALLERMLRKAGYLEIRGASDSRKVLETCKEFDPDLLVLDLIMPHLDGFEVLRQLQSRDGDNGYLPVLVLTADGEHETRIRALQSGAKDFLTKPIDQVEVLTRIQNMLEIRLTHKALLAHNARLEEEVRERTKDLHASYLELVGRLARATGFRDADTGLHISRISHYCATLGHAAGLNPHECDLLLNASALHDIGKIGIRDKILLKPGSFDEDESEAMREHVTIGGKILANSQYPMIQWAEIIALTHHERWDGSGYPEGLRGEEIPLMGRIVALCDVFDALTSERPYKSAWSEEQAIEELEKQSGSQFDPKLVALFRKVLPEILHVKNRFAKLEQSEGGMVGDVFV